MRLCGLVSTSVAQMIGDCFFGNIYFHKSKMTLSIVNQPIRDFYSDLINTKYF